MQSKFTINTFPCSASSDTEVIDFYKSFDKINSSDTEEIILDLSKASSNDLKTIAAVDSIARYFLNRKISIRAVNIPSSCNNSMHKMGLQCNEEGYFSYLEQERHNIPFFESVADATLNFFKDAANLFYFTGDLFLIICRSVRHPSKVKWRETFYYMDKAGTDAIPIVLLLCFLLGGILAFQGIVQMGKFGLAIYTANLVGLSIVKELGVLMVAIICTGRAGSAFAAEISTMKVNEEIDAMKTMGLDSASFLVLPKMIALICVMPMLTILGNVAGIIGGMVVGCLMSDITLNEYYIRTIAYLKCSDIFESLFKSVTYAVLISGISCLRGIEAERDAKGVGHAATSAVVSSIFLIVIADAMITVILNT